MERTNSGWSVASSLRRHGSIRSPELLNSSTDNPGLKQSIQSQQRLSIIGNNSPRFPTYVYLDPPITSNPVFNVAFREESVDIFSEPLRIRGAPSNSVNADNPRIFSNRVTQPTEQLEQLNCDPEAGKNKENSRKKKKKKKTSAFLQQALLGSQNWCRTPCKPKPVVVQDDPKLSAQLLRSSQEAEGVARRLQLPPSPRPRTDRRPKTPTDESDRTKEKVTLDLEEFLKELESAIPKASHVHFAEYTRLYKDAANPTKDTRDTELQPALPSTSEGLRRSRRRKRDEASSGSETTPTRQSRRRR